MSPPAPDEVVVAVAAAGVCHTDLAIADGLLWPYYPLVLGHEIAGTIAAVGTAVRGHQVGDRVVVMDGHCGRCGDCERGHPVQCRTFDQQERKGFLHDKDGSPVLASVGGFAQEMLTPAHSVFPLPGDVSFEVGAIAGCSVVTGVGAVLNVADVRAGQRVAVLGCGGVGLNAVMAAAARGASTVVAVDPAAGRRDLAIALGATDACPPDEQQLRDQWPDGFDVVVECVGAVPVMELAPRLLARGGAMVLVGATPEGTTFQLDALDVLLNQKRVLGCLRGDVRPAVDFPVIWDLYRSGALPLDRLVTDRIRLDQIDVAFDPSNRGRGLRTVVIP